MYLRLESGHHKFDSFMEFIKSGAKGVLITNGFMNGIMPKVLGTFIRIFILYPPILIDQ